MSAPAPPPYDILTHADRLFDASERAFGNITLWYAGSRPPKDRAAAIERLRGHLDTIDDAARQLRAMLPPPPPPESL